MSDLCDLCTLNCPTSGCAKLSHESCLKEAIQSIKPSVTNGEVIQALFPVESIYKEEYVEVVFKGQNHATFFTLDFWDAPYKAESEGTE